MGCWVAAMAMIVGKSYAEVKAETGNTWQDGGHRWKTEQYLAQHGFAVMPYFDSDQFRQNEEPNEHGIRLNKRWQQWPFVPFAPVHICLVTSGPTGGGHIVVMLADGRVLDPATPDTRRLSEYFETREMIGVWPVRAALASCRCGEAQQELADLEATFDLRWKADMRAIERWRKERPGRELTLPDHADLCGWLLERIDEINGTLKTENPGIPESEIRAIRTSIADEYIADGQPPQKVNWMYGRAVLARAESDQLRRELQTAREELATVVASHQKRNAELEQALDELDQRDKAVANFHRAIEWLLGITIKAEPWYQPFLCLIRAVKDRQNAAPGVCTRSPGHDGPCDGYPASTCKPGTSNRDKGAL